MTVGELIEELKLYDSDLEVACRSNSGDYYEISDIDECNADDNEGDICGNCVRIWIYD